MNDVSFGTIKRRLMSENARCELCGGLRGLDVHHIIPKVCGGSDRIDNLIVICSGCHGKLTPKSELTKIGLEKAKNTGTRLGRSKGDKLTTKKSVIAKEVIIKESADFNGFKGDVELISEIGIARGTYYKYKRELKAERKLA